jgi:formate/nitrite transporter
MAKRAEEIGVRKAEMDGPGLFTLAVLAGAFIALGGVFSTVALSATGETPWGPARVLAGTVFSVGLILVVVGGAELFTGNNLIVMAWAGGRVRTAALLRNWAIVYVGNFAGALAVAAAVWAAGTHEAGGGAFGATALGIAAAKMRLGFGQAVALGILCNVLVCLAVWLTYSARTTADRILAIVPPISAFVAAGNRRRDAARPALRVVELHGASARAVRHAAARPQGLRVRHRGHDAGGARAERGGGVVRR